MRGSTWLPIGVQFRSGSAIPFAATQNGAASRGSSLPREATNRGRNHVSRSLFREPFVGLIRRHRPSTVPRDIHRTNPFRAESKRNRFDLRRGRQTLSTPRGKHLTHMPIAPSTKVDRLNHRRVPIEAARACTRGRAGYLHASPSEESERGHVVEFCPSDQSRPAAAGAGAIVSRWPG